MGKDFDAVIDDILARTPGVVESVGARLPAGFPARVAEPIFKGLLLQAKRLASEALEGCA
jgi:serine/threonine-protein kinase HipA